MSRGTIRWVAIAVIGAMVAFLAVGLIGGRGEEAGSARRDTAGSVDTVGTTSDAAALDGPHVVLELCTGVACARQSAEQQRQLEEEVAADPRVASTRFVTAEQAYELFLDRYGDDQELVDRVDPDTVPAEIQVDLHRVEDVDEVLAAFEGHEGVAAARDARVTSAEP